MKDSKLSVKNAIQTPRPVLGVIVPMTIRNGAIPINDYVLRNRSRDTLPFSLRREFLSAEAPVHFGTPHNEWYLLSSLPRMMTPSRPLSPALFSPIYLSTSPDSFGGLLPPLPAVATSPLTPTTPPTSYSQSSSQSSFYYQAFLPG